MDRSSGPTILSTQPRNECVNETRVTRTGKIIRYELRIVQQPERARACGAGAKASADRRPVDPPPILALRIYEQASANHVEQDVTFQIQADHLVFTQLVSAERRIAQARNMPSVNNHNGADGAIKREVLAGQSVASASPYERPEPALYFIFPDLSVRHEGKYRFIFSMYERLKSPENEDRNELLQPSPAGDISCCIEIESATFDVYSAKRFPGLTTSTHLSRQLAEQGSRIRIRRDIRMHRKDKKPQAKDWDDYHDDESNTVTGTNDMLASQPSRLLHTPDPYAQQPPRYSGDTMQRPQSASSRGHPTTADSLSRRTSLNDLNHSYMLQPSQQQQQQQQSVFTHPSNAAYGSLQAPSYSQQSYMHPPTQYSAPPYQSQPQSQSQQQVPHHQQPQQQQQQNYYQYGSASQHQQQMQYPPISTAFDTNSYHQRASGEYSATSADSRRTSMQSIVPQQAAPFYGSQSTSAQPAQQPSYSQQNMYSDNIPQAHPQDPQQTQQPTASQSSDIFLPRDQTSAVPHARITDPNPPALSSKPDFSADLPTKLPPLTTRSFDNKLDAATAASPSTAAPVSSFSSSLPTPTESHKRAYGSTFATSWQNMANKQGARPGDDVFTSNGLSLAADPDIDSASDTIAPYERVTYRRAGGSTATRTHV